MLREDGSIFSISSSHSMKVLFIWSLALSIFLMASAPGVSTGVTLLEKSSSLSFALCLIAFSREFFPQSSAREDSTVMSTFCIALTTRIHSKTPLSAAIASGYLASARPLAAVAHLATSGIRGRILLTCFLAKSIASVSASS